ncbi:hypothetical protein DPMN_027471 [Dreissena polymorpha]|uniref:Uncharacterized protein n=1 Tax=Dreissena polymorpha TaxID=45954 RepID=A0A9D4LVD7_DREPO|nr:hypothetical protein DPMN_027471 [Dreissena polymorpha]
MISDWVRSLDHFFSSQIFWHSAVNAAVVASAPCLISSEQTLSTPGDFPALRLRNASSTSALRMGGLSSSAASGLGSF